MTQNTYTCNYHKNNNGMGGIAMAIDSDLVFKINANNEAYALDNDEVIVIANTPMNDATPTIAKIVKITRHNTTNLLGYIQKYKDKFLLRVDDHKFGNYLVIIETNDQQFKFEREQLYNAVIISYPNDTQNHFHVQLTNTIGKVDDDSRFIRNLIKENQIPYEFSLKVIEEAKNSDRQPDLAKGTRIDLRDLDFVTIDGEDAKDFDDAVYAVTTSDGYDLYVAIADVANYVTPGSALDNEAYLRGTSIYFPKSVIPMLPEQLSNNLCSLLPNADRLVMCCKITINHDGSIKKYQVFNAIIHSKARLTYVVVEEWLNELSNAPKELVSNISTLYLVYNILAEARRKRGAIDFNSTEAKFVFDHDGMVETMVPRQRLTSHKLIEEAMLAANVCVADFLLTNNRSGIFRIHPKPSEEKFNNLKLYLNSLAIPFPVKYKNLLPRDYANLLIQIKDHSNYQTIEQKVLTSMQLATYSEENIGHFGLSYDKYLHFTSPIRRYPDLFVHRIIKDIISGDTTTLSHKLHQVGEWTSLTERRAEELSRKIESFYKCQYARSHIGKIFTGTVSSVVNFGIFVYIPDLMLDGLVHITNLSADYFIFDEIRHILYGKRTGIKYEVGQELKIEIAAVDMTKLFIDFHLHKE